MRKADLENLNLTGHIEVKRDRGRQRAAYLIILCECMAEQDLGGLATGQTFLRATRDRRLWRAMIAHILEGARHIKEEPSSYRPFAGDLLFNSLSQCHNPGTFDGLL